MKDNSNRHWECLMSFCGVGELNEDEIAAYVKKPEPPDHWAGLGDNG